MRLPGHPEHPLQGPPRTSSITDAACPPPREFLPIVSTCSGPLRSRTGESAREFVPNDRDVVLNESSKPKNCNSLFSTGRTVDSDPHAAHIRALTSTGHGGVSRRSIAAQATESLSRNSDWHEICSACNVNRHPFSHVQDHAKHGPLLHSSRALADGCDEPNRSRAEGRLGCAEQVRRH